MGRRVTASIGLLLAITVFGSACTKKAANPAATASPKEEYKTSSAGNADSFLLVAKDQDSNGTDLVIDKAVFKDHTGYVAIHANANGAPGPVIGVSGLLPQGETDNIKIALTQPLTKSDIVQPMLHLEDNNNTTYDFPNGDAPATVDKKVVVFPIKVVVGKS